MADAQRILGVMDAQIDKKIRSGAQIDVTYGQVYTVIGNTASVYLAGARELAASLGDTADPSEGFRVPAHMQLSASDYVRVSMDLRGHRWVDEILPNSVFQKVALDPNRGMMLGSGADQPIGGTVGQTPIVNAAGNQVWANPANLLSFAFVVATPSASASTEMALQDSTSAAVRINIPWDFEVVGLSIRASQARTSGTATVVPRIEGVATTLSATLDASHTTALTATGAETANANKGIAGNDIGVLLTTSGWAPTAGQYIHGHVYINVHKLPVVAAVVTNSFTADAIIASAPSFARTFTADAVLKRVGVAGSFTADAFLLSNQPPAPSQTGILGTADSKLGSIVLGKG